MTKRDRSLTRKITIDNGLGAEVAKVLRGAGIWIHRDIPGLSHLTDGQVCPCNPIFVHEDDTRSKEELCEVAKPRLA